VLRGLLGGLDDRSVWAIVGTDFAARETDRKHASRRRQDRHTGAALCRVEHVGFVLSGTATAAFEDGRIIELLAGELFHIPASRLEAQSFQKNFDLPFYPLPIVGNQSRPRDARDISRNDLRNNRWLEFLGELAGFLGGFEKPD